MNEKKLSILIPTFKLKEDRLRILRFLIINYLSKLNVDVFICEQIHYESDKELISLSAEYDNIHYLSFRSDKKVFHKSKLLNSSAEKIYSEYLWFLDAEVFLKYSEIIDLVTDQNVIRPFKHILRLDKARSDQFMTYKKLVIKKGSILEATKRFGPLTFIIKREIYLKNKMDENFIGYGWEDLDFAYRILENYDVVEFDNHKGLHLYHKMTKNHASEERENQRIFLQSRLKFDQLKLHNINQKDFDVTTLYNPPTYNANTKIVHILSPALLPDKQGLYNRELLSLKSIKRESDQYKNCEVILLCDSSEASKYSEDFEVVLPLRTSRDIGDSRGLMYISDMFNIASERCNDDDIIFYSNSDCCIRPGTYFRLANTKSVAVEYHRLDVNDDPKNLEEVFTNSNELKETGVDGLSFRKKFYLENKYMVPDFFSGEPHWDTAISGCLRGQGLSEQIIYDLYHPIHEQAWTTSDLSISGKNNTRIYRDFLEFGISKIPIIQKPIIDIVTSVVIVHYGNDAKRIDAVKRNLARLQYQNILNCEYIFVELVENETSFPELNNKPDWNHIIIPCKDSNKNIWQKESMMNIGAKNANGSIIIFIDSDVCSIKNDWLTRITNKIKENPEKIVHCYGICQDSSYPVDHCFTSTGMSICSKFQSDLMINPGLAIAFSKDMLERNNYLNQYSIMGGGDSIVLHEYLGNTYPECKAWAECRPRIKNTIRELNNTAIFDYVEDCIIHENHGDVFKRNYVNRHYATDYFRKEIQELVVIGYNGLLEWVDPECLEREVVKRRPEMTSIPKVKRICRELLNERL